MRLYITVFLLFALVYTACDKQQERVGKKIIQKNIVLSSQEDINSFVEEYKDAEALTIDGSLTIGKLAADGDDSNITSLEGLATLTRVTKNLTLSKNQLLTSVKGLENLRQVNGTLKIFNNGQIENLELYKLKKADSIVIDQNNRLKSISSLDTLTTASTLVIRANGNLESLQGLQGIDTLRNLHITQNNKLRDLTGLDSLKGIGGRMFIQENAGITSLKGLEKVKKVGADINILSNPLLLSLAGLEALTDAGTFNIGSNQQLLSFCTIRKAAVRLIESKPEAEPAELVNIYENGKDPYTYDDLIRDCPE